MFAGSWDKTVITNVELLRLFLISKDNGIDEWNAAEQVADVLRSLFPIDVRTVKNLKAKLLRLVRTKKGRNESSPIQVEFLSKRNYMP